MGIGLFYNSGNNLAVAAMVAEFTKIDALPSAYVQTATGDGDGDVDSCKASLGMCRHVVAAFKGVLVIGLVLWYEMVEDCRQVTTYIWVVILVQAESTTGVFDEKVQQTSFGQGGQLTCNFVGHQVAASRTWTQSDFHLSCHDSERI